MKRSITTLALFVVLTIAFSSLTGCGGTQTATGNNAAKPGANTNAKTGDNTAKSTAFPPLATGLAEAEFMLLDGGKFKLSDKKGKVLLVTIWGTWCGPCIAEMPTLIELQNQYREQGLEVIGLNIGDGAGTPEPILARLAGETDRIMRSPDVQAKLQNEGLKYTAMGPEAFAAFVRAEAAQWAKVVRAVGVQAD